MNIYEERKKITLEDLLELMATLRSEDGCPWDRDQTKDSLKPYVIEESYEVVEAVDEQAPHKIKEELGDLLFQIVFYAQLLKEEDHIDIYDIIETVHTKMIRRHPHVFDSCQLVVPPRFRPVADRRRRKRARSTRGPSRHAGVSAAGADGPPQGRGIVHTRLVTAQQNQISPSRNVMPWTSGSGTSISSSTSPVSGSSRWTFPIPVSASHKAPPSTKTP